MNSPLPQLVPAFKRGTVVGGYELLAPLGTGGMARVWCARPVGDEGFDRLVAVKTIHPHLVADVSARTLFQTEIYIGQSVMHPNICSTLAAGEHQGAPYLVMDWVAGDSLQSIVRNSGPLPVRLLVHIVQQVALALAALHRAERDGVGLGIVHRDVSPDNILISAEGDVKLIDFGVARSSFLQGKADKDLRGKVRYMAPEQLALKNIDGRADIFSLSCVFYELAAGKPPFDGETDVQVIHSLLNGELMLPSRLRDDFPNQLEGVLIKAMSEDPTYRFPAAEKMADALASWLAGSGPDITRKDLAAFVNVVSGVRIATQRTRIREGDTLSGFVPPLVPVRPVRPQSMTPSGPSISRVMPKKHALPFVERGQVEHGYTEDVPVTSTSSWPHAHSKWNYILAGSIGVAVALVGVLLALLFR
ncbi:MAG: serine/threonine protein kinase [Polyangiaceae bacterium]|nr:serine/threonine protein kinase [Polyangiaceae bacterium]